MRGKRVDLPVSNEVIEQLTAGDKLRLYGTIHTARDAAHKRFLEAIAKGNKLPVDLEETAIYYTGPCPPRPGMAIGSIGATTSSRMDPYVEPLLKRGLKIMIGKGPRNDYVRDLCVKYKAVYLLVYGGIAALATRDVKDARVVAYEDLGTEAVRALEVTDFKVLVGIDTRGNDLYIEGVKRYRR